MHNPSPRPPSSSPVKISHGVLPSQDLPLRGLQCQGPPQRPPFSALPSKPSGKPTTQPTPSAESAARTSRFRTPVESLIKVVKVVAKVVVNVWSECHRWVTTTVKVMSSRCHRCVIKVVNVVANVVVKGSSKCHRCVIKVVYFIAKVVAIASSKCHRCVINVIKAIATESSGCRRCVITVVKVAWNESTVQLVNVVKAADVIKLVDARVGVAKLTGGLSRMPEAKPARNLQRKKSETAAPRPTSTAQKT